MLTITVKTLACSILLLIPLILPAQYLSQASPADEPPVVYTIVSQPAMEQLKKGMDEVDSFLDKLQSRMTELMRLNEQLIQENEQLNQQMAAVNQQIEKLVEENDILFASNNADVMWTQDVIDGNRAHIITLEQQHRWCSQQIAQNERQMRAYQELLQEYEDQYEVQDEYRSVWMLMED